MCTQSSVAVESMEVYQYPMSTWAWEQHSKRLWGQRRMSCTVGEMILALGQYVEYSVSMLPLEELDTEMRVDALAIWEGPIKDHICLTSGELNYKTRSWSWKMTSWIGFKPNKLGWELSYTQQLGVAFVNTYM